MTDGVAFLSFMSVAGVPAFLEHRAIYLRERKNGLVSPSAFVLATAIADIPFLIMCTLLYTSIAYGSLGLHKGAGHYFRYTSYVSLPLPRQGCPDIQTGLPLRVCCRSADSFDR